MTNKPPPPSAKYLSEFVMLDCAHRLLAERLFPNPKEITESMGAWAAIKQKLPNLDRRDETVTVVAVGDGCTPRTGGLIASLTAWRVISVDPKLRGQYPNIKRLECVQGRIQDQLISSRGPLVVVAVHSHATLAQTMHGLSRNDVGQDIHVIAIPCCVPQWLAVRPTESYEDPHIHSPARRVRVWANLPWWAAGRGSAEEMVGRRQSSLAAKATAWLPLVRES